VKTHSPLFYAHWELAPKARAALPADYAERALYVATGEIEHRGTRYAAGKMLVFAAAEDSTITATQPATVMALGGEPIGERFIEWNFVSSSKARIEQAKADWRAGRMKLPDFDNQEFIPLT
jgi:redox-sensitive bicupin YhaK (pirin superfamily)